ARRAGPEGAKGRTPEVIHLPVWDRTPETDIEKNAEGYPSGQRGQTVNLLAYAFGGSNPPPSTNCGDARKFAEVDGSWPVVIHLPPPVPAASRDAQAARLVGFRAGR